MTWRIRITPDAGIGDDGGIAIQVARRIGDRGHYEQIRFERTSDIQATEGVVMPVPSFTLNDDLGRALLDALAGYYGGTTGGVQQRADFEHERGRVDRLIGALIERSAA